MGFLRTRVGEDHLWDVQAGSLFKAAGRIFAALQGSGMSPLEEARLKLLELELQDRLGVPVAERFRWSDLVEELPERGTYFVLGDIGSGKTAFGVELVVRLGDRDGVPTFVVGAAPGWGDALGLQERPSMSQVPRRSVCLVDEAGLIASQGRRKVAAELRKLSALARHAGISWVLTAQSGAYLDLEVLRAGGVLCLKELDRMRVRFDREELAEELEAGLRLQEGMDWSVEQVLLRLGGQWVVSANPLPFGWSEDLSVGHRGAFPMR